MGNSKSSKKTKVAENDLGANFGEHALKFGTKMTLHVGQPFKIVGQHLNGPFSCCGARKKCAPVATSSTANKACFREVGRVDRFEGTRQTRVDFLTTAPGTTTLATNRTCGTWSRTCVTVKSTAQYVADHPGTSLVMILAVAKGKSTEPKSSSEALRLCLPIILLRFNAIDADGDGVLSPAELKSIPGLEQLVADAGKQSLITNNGGLRLKDFMQLPDVQALLLEPDSINSGLRLVSPLYVPYRERYRRSRVDQLIFKAAFGGPDYEPSRAEMASEEAAWKRVQRFPGVGHRLGGSASGASSGSGGGDLRPDAARPSEDVATNNKTGMSRSASEVKQEAEAELHFSTEC